tara:strand:- start:15824 stop:16873 length:1050 start_codon:yes stop_codon:yes gene_type:complete
MAWLGLHILIIVMLHGMENDLTLGGVGYHFWFWFAVVGNVIAFASAANSNPGYVDERDPGDRDRVAEEGRGRVEEGVGGGTSETSNPPQLDARDKGKAPENPAVLSMVVEEDENDEDDENMNVELLGLPNSSTAHAGSSSRTSGSSDVHENNEDDVEETPEEIPCGQVCKHCDAWQGLRTKHCHDCGRCVRKFDHHCFWVGTCVGEKNHARFTTYLCTETAGILWAFHISNTGVRYYDTWDEIFSKNAGPVIMSFFLFIFILFVGGLCGFHVYCVVTGQTTWEIASKQKIRYLKNVPANVYAFDKGPVENVKQFCCLPPPARYEMRSMSELRGWSKKETIWENRYWVCC